MRNNLAKYMVFTKVFDNKFPRFSSPVLRHFSGIQMPCRSKHLALIGP